MNVPLLLAETPTVNELLGVDVPVWLVVGVAEPVSLNDGVQVMVHEELADTPTVRELVGVSLPDGVLEGVSEGDSLAAGVSLQGVRVGNPESSGSAQKRTARLHAGHILQMLGRKLFSPRRRRRRRNSLHYPPTNAGGQRNRQKRNGGLALLRGHSN